MAQRVWHPLNKPFSNRHGLARQRLFRFAQLALEGEQTIQSNPIQSLILHIEMHFAIVSFCWIETFQLTIFVDIWKTEEKKLTAISDREMKECLINEWSFMFFCIWEQQQQSKWLKIAHTVMEYDGIFHGTNYVHAIIHGALF